MGNWFSKLFGSKKTDDVAPDNNESLNSEMQTETPVAPEMETANVEPEPISEVEEEVTPETMPESEEEDMVLEEELKTEPETPMQEEVAEESQVETDDAGNKEWE